MSFAGLGFQILDRAPKATLRAVSNGVQRLPVPVPVPVPVPTKLCPQCGNVKRIDAFGWRNKGKYRQTYCKSCCSQNTRDYAKRNPHKVNAQNRKWRGKHRRHNYEYHLQYRQAHPEKNRIYSARYRQRNPDKDREIYLAHRPQRLANVARYNVLHRPVAQRKFLAKLELQIGRMLSLDEQRSVISALQAKLVTLGNAHTVFSETKSLAA